MVSHPRRYNNNNNNNNNNNIDSLKLVYFACFHTVVKYGKIFWGNEHHVNKVFISPKRILRIMLGWATGVQVVLGLSSLRY